MSVLQIATYDCAGFNGKPQVIRKFGVFNYPRYITTSIVIVILCSISPSTMCVLAKVPVLDRFKKVAIFAVF